MFEFGKEIVAVFAVLGALGAGLWTLRRLQVPHPVTASPLRAVATLRLSANLVLHMVDCAGEPCLVAEQKAGCSITPLRQVARGASNCS